MAIRDGTKRGFIDIGELPRVKRVVQNIVHLKSDQAIKFLNVFPMLTSLVLICPDVWKVHSCTT